MLRSVRVVALLTAIMALTSCGVHETARPLSPIRATYDLEPTDETPLTVNIGKQTVGTNSYTITANPSDTTLPLDYTWFVLHCPGPVDPNDCVAPSEQSTKAKSWTLTIIPSVQGTKTTVVLEAKQTVDGGNSGAKYIQIITPPMARGTVVGGFTCSLGSTYLWPNQKFDRKTSTFVPDTVTVPWNYRNAGERVVQQYRRSPCNGIKELQYK